MSRLAKLIASLVLAAVAAGCATQGLVPVSSPRAQILEAYNLIEASAKTRDELVTAAIIDADAWRSITAELRRYLAAVTQYDQAVREGIPSLDRERAFTLAMQGLMRLRAELAARQPKPPPPVQQPAAAGARS